MLWPCFDTYLHLDTLGFLFVDIVGAIFRIPYFLKHEREIVYWDWQLDEFRCLDWDWTDDKRTFDRFKKLWFKFIILDTNTYTIEKDPNWSLHKKFKRFVDFANKNLQIVYNKPENWIAFMILWDKPKNEIDLEKAQQQMNQQNQNNQTWNLSDSWSVVYSWSTNSWVNNWTWN